MHLLTWVIVCLAVLHIESGAAYDLCSDPEAVIGNTSGSTYDEYIGYECNFSNSFVAQLPRSTDLSTNKSIIVRFDRIHVENGGSAFIGMILEYASKYEEIYQFAPLRVTVANSTFVNAGLTIKGHQPRGSTLLVINNTFTRARAVSMPAAILWLAEFSSSVVSVCVDTDVRIEANTLLVNISRTDYALRVFHVKAEGKSLFFGAGRCDFLNNAILLLESFSIAFAPICTIFVESNDLTIRGPVTISGNSMSFEYSSAAAVVLTLLASVSVAFVSVEGTITLADIATLRLLNNSLSGVNLSFLAIVRVAIVITNANGNVFYDSLTLYDSCSLEIAGNRATLAQSKFSYIGPQPTIVAAEVSGSPKLHLLSTVAVSNNSIELKGVTILRSAVVADVYGVSMLLAGSVELRNNSLLAIGVTAPDSSGTRFVASKIVATGASRIALSSLVEISDNALIMADSEIGVHLLCAAFVGYDGLPYHPLEVSNSDASLVLANNSIAISGGHCNATVSTVLIQGATLSLADSSHILVANNTLAFSSYARTYTRVDNTLNSGWHYVVNVVVKGVFTVYPGAAVELSGNVMRVAGGCVVRSRTVVVAAVDIGDTMRLRPEARFIAERNGFEAGPTASTIATSTDMLIPALLVLFVRFNLKGDTGLRMGSLATFEASRNFVSILEFNVHTTLVSTVRLAFEGTITIDSGASVLFSGNAISLASARLLTTKASTAALTTDADEDNAVTSVLIFFSTKSGAVTGARNVLGTAGSASEPGAAFALLNNSLSVADRSAISDRLGSFAVFLNLFNASSLTVGSRAALVSFGNRVVFMNASSTNSNVCVVRAVFSGNLTVGSNASIALTDNVLEAHEFLGETSVSLTVVAFITMLIELDVGASAALARNSMRMIACTLASGGIRAAIVNLYAVAFGNNSAVSLSRNSLSVKDTHSNQGMVQTFAVVSLNVGGAGGPLAWIGAQCAVTLKDNSFTGENTQITGSVSVATLLAASGFTTASSVEMDPSDEAGAQITVSGNTFVGNNVTLSETITVASLYSSNGRGTEPLLGKLARITFADNKFAIRHDSSLVQSVILSQFSFWSRASVVLSSRSRIEFVRNTLVIEDSTMDNRVSGQIRAALVTMPSSSTPAVDMRSSATIRMAHNTILIRNSSVAAAEISAAFFLCGSVLNVSGDSSRLELTQNSVTVQRQTRTTPPPAHTSPAKVSAARFEITTGLSAVGPHTFILGSNVSVLLQGNTITVLAGFFDPYTSLFAAYLLFSKPNNGRITLGSYSRLVLLGNSLVAAGGEADSTFAALFSALSEGIEVDPTSSSATVELSDNSVALKGFYLHPEGLLSCAYIESSSWRDVAVTRMDRNVVEVTDNSTIHKKVSAVRFSSGYVAMASYSLCDIRDNVIYFSASAALDSVQTVDVVVSSTIALFSDATLDASNNTVTVQNAKSVNGVVAACRVRLKSNLELSPGAAMSLTANNLSLENTHNIKGGCVAVELAAEGSVSLMGSAVLSLALNSVSVRNVTSLAGPYESSVRLLFGLVLAIASAALNISSNSMRVDLSSTAMLTEVRVVTVLCGDTACRLEIDSGVLSISNNELLASDSVFNRHVFVVSVFLPIILVSQNSGEATSSGGVYIEKNSMRCDASTEIKYDANTVFWSASNLTLFDEALFRASQNRFLFGAGSSVRAACAVRIQVGLLLLPFATLQLDGNEVVVVDSNISTLFVVHLIAYSTSSLSSNANALAEATSTVGLVGNSLKSFRANIAQSVRCAFIELTSAVTIEGNVSLVGNTVVHERAQFVPSSVALLVATAALEAPTYEFSLDTKALLLFQDNELEVRLSALDPKRLVRTSFVNVQKFTLEGGSSAVFKNCSLLISQSSAPDTAAATAVVVLGGLLMSERALLEIAHSVVNVVEGSSPRSVVAVNLQTQNAMLSTGSSISLNQNRLFALTNSALGKASFMTVDVTTGSCTFLNARIDISRNVLNISQGAVLQIFPFGPSSGRGVVFRWQGKLGFSLVELYASTKITIERNVAAIVVARGERNASASSTEATSVSIALLLIQCPIALYGANAELAILHNSIRCEEAALYGGANLSASNPTIHGISLAGSPQALTFAHPEATLRIAHNSVDLGIMSPSESVCSLVSIYIMGLKSTLGAPSGNVTISSNTVALGAVPSDHEHSNTLESCSWLFIGGLQQISSTTIAHNEVVSWRSLATITIEGDLRVEDGAKFRVTGNVVRHDTTGGATNNSIVSVKGLLTIAGAADGSMAGGTHFSVDRNAVDFLEVPSAVYRPLPTAQYVLSATRFAVNTSVKWEVLRGVFSNGTNMSNFMDLCGNTAYGRILGRESADWLLFPLNASTSFMYHLASMCPVATLSSSAAASPSRSMPVSFSSSRSSPLVPTATPTSSRTVTTPKQPRTPTREEARTPTRTRVYVPIPAPSFVPIVAGERLAQGVGAVAVLSPVGGQLGVANALSRLLSCGAGEDEDDDVPVMVHPLRFSVGKGAEGMYAGASISDTAVIPLAFALLVRGPLIFGLQRYSRMSEQDALTLAGWPFVVAMPLVTLAEGIGVSITRALQADPHSSPHVVALGVFGLLFLLAFVAAWLKALLVVIPRSAVCVSRDELHGAVRGWRGSNGTLLSSRNLRRLVVWLIEPRRDWVPKHDVHDKDDDETELTPVLLVDNNDSATNIHFDERENERQAREETTVSPRRRGAADGRRQRTSASTSVFSAPLLALDGNEDEDPEFSTSLPSRRRVKVGGSKPSPLQVTNATLERFGAALGGKWYFYAEIISFGCSLAVGVAEGVQPRESIHVCRGRVAFAAVATVAQCAISCMTFVPLEQFLQVVLSFCVVPSAILTVVFVAISTSPAAAASEDDAFDRSASLSAVAEGIAWLTLVANGVGMGLLVLQVGTSLRSVVVSRHASHATPPRGRSQRQSALPPPLAALSLSFSLAGDAANNTLKPNKDGLVFQSDGENDPRNDGGVGVVNTKIRAHPSPCDPHLHTTTKSPKLIEFAAGSASSAQSSSVNADDSEPTAPPHRSRRGAPLAAVEESARARATEAAAIEAVLQELERIDSEKRTRFPGS